MPTGFAKKMYISNRSVITAISKPGDKDGCLNTSALGNLTKLLGMTNIQVERNGFISCSLNG